MSLELNPQKVKPFLKLLTEATVQLNNNKGSLRKDIWDYLYNKYQDSIDYRDFLLAIRKFKTDGKLNQNSEGIISMHPQILTEVREKTPTPVFAARDGTGNIYLNMLSGSSKQKQVQNKESETKTQQNGNVSSKISNQGKQQKIKGRVFNLGVEKKAEKQEVKKEEKQSINKNRLGFQTPIAQTKKSPRVQKMNLLSEQKERRPLQSSIHKKYQNMKQDKQARRKIFNHISQLSKKISKQKKFIQVPQKPQKQVQSSSVTKTQETGKVSKQKTPTKPSIQKSEAERSDSKVKIPKKIENFIKKQLKQAFKLKNLKLKKKIIDIASAKKERQEKIYKKAEKRASKTLNLSQRPIRHRKPKLPFDQEEEKNQKTTTSTTNTQLQSPQKQKKKQQEKEEQQHTPIRKTKVTEERVLRSSGKKQKKPLTTSEKKTKQIKKESPKKIELEKKQVKKIQKKFRRELTKKERIQKIMKRLINGLFTGKVGKERKAKLHAVQTIKQLFINKKNKDQMFVDEKLIYI